MTSSFSVLLFLFFFPTLSPFCLSAAVSVLYLHLSPALCSGSGSGNRSVSCHYWSNSVIRHRALTVCSALYAGTAGVLRTEVEIRFDTHTQARGDDGGRGTRALNVCTCVCVSKKVKDRNRRMERLNFCVHVCAGECGYMTVYCCFNRNAAAQVALCAGKRYRGQNWIDKTSSHNRREEIHF